MSDYGTEKMDSEVRDRELGFNIAEVEEKIRARLAQEGSPDRRQTWTHLSPQIFQTPYEELARIIHAADPDHRFEKWADLGAAYGRLGIVLAQIRPGARFIGVELVSERVEEGRRVFARLGLDPLSLVCMDLAKSEIPNADAYFIYDFGTREEIGKVLEMLRERARTYPLLIVGRGRGIRDAIEREHPWLGSVITPLHFAHYTIYRSA